MPNVPFFTDDPASYDRVVFGGIELPGIAEIEDLEVSSRWDIKEAPGTDGATETYKGYTPASFSIRVRLWEPEHYRIWQNVLSQIRPRPGKSAPGALDVTHPDTAIWGIKAAIVTSIRGPLKGGATNDERHFVIACREYFAPKKKNVTGTASASKGGPGPKNQDRVNWESNASDRPIEPKLPSHGDVPPGATEDGVPPSGYFESLGSLGKVPGFTE